MYEFTPFKKRDKLSYESFIQFPRELLNREKFNDIMNKYPNLQFILEDRELILNETECKMLQKLVKIYMEICDFEEKEIFLLGGKGKLFCWSSFTCCIIPKVWTW